MQIKQLSFSLPLSVSLNKYRTNSITEKSFLLQKKVKNFTEKIYIFFLSLFKRTPQDSSYPNAGNPRLRNNRFSSDKLLKIGKLILLVVISIGILTISLRMIMVRSGNPSSEGKVEVMGAKSTQELNKEYSFPLYDEAGNEVSQIKYIIDRAELRDEIVVKGQKVNAIKGRTFLIMTLRIINQYEKAIDINTRDYIRLAVNGDGGEWLAPDIHNDPVNVQAISTKYTRLGFPIDDGTDLLMLQIGEVNGEKDKIILDL